MMSQVYLLVIKEVELSLPRAAFAAALATLASTTDARKATVDIMGFPLCENGTG